MGTLYLIIPCYNEAEVLHETAKRLLAKLNDLIKADMISKNSRILFVNDGSKDSTWEIISQLHRGNKVFSGICFSHNEGQQNALYAGYITAIEYADIIISIDADLQDDLNAIDKMLDEYFKGNDIVYGVKDHKNDSLFRKITNTNFYRVAKIMGIKLVPNHSSCRLMSRRAVEALCGYEEVNLFLPGIIPQLGFKNSIVCYEKQKRYAGKSKYSVKRLFSLASEALTSFSLKPIRFIFDTGVLFFLISFVIFIYMLVQTAHGNMENWLLILASVWAISGITMIALGIIGEYAGKTYFETKQRPRYIISETLIEPEPN